MPVEMFQPVVHAFLTEQVPEFAGDHTPDDVRGEVEEHENAPERQEQREDAPRPGQRLGNLAVADGRERDHGHVQPVEERPWRPSISG